MPIPTISNLRPYNRVLAIGFNLVLRDRILVFGFDCFNTRTVFILTALLFTGAIFPLSLGIGGLTAVGRIAPDFGCCPPEGFEAELILWFRRVSAIVVPGSCFLAFFCPTFWTGCERWRRGEGCRRVNPVSLLIDSDTATPCDLIDLFFADSRPETELF